MMAKFSSLTSVGKRLNCFGTSLFLLKAASDKQRVSSKIRMNSLSAQVSLSLLRWKLKESPSGGGGAGFLLISRAKSSCDHKEGQLPRKM